MKYLWVDDVRVPPGGAWVWAKTVDEAKKYLSTGEVEYASFDHDLGEGGSGTDLINWLDEEAHCGHNHWPKVRPNVHSANVVGRMYMQRVINTHYPSEM